ncbi:MAG TPA: alpha/beta hydrolase [Acidimicrobiales bacterium]|nr:alpha/beta hydrolase [Acidimicrobiales bacterium]
MSGSGRRREIGLALAGAAAAAAGVGLALTRARRRHLRPPEDGSARSELELPPGTRHLDIPVRDGGSVHVAEWGSGPPIVLLHGATLSSEVWAYQFRDLGAGRRLIALDLRGHGQSEPGEEGVTIGAMADDLADVLEALDLRRATVVGHSMGGMTALRFCRRHPEVLSARVGAIAIVASAGGIQPPLAGWERLAPRVAGLIVAGHGAVNQAGWPIMPGNGAAARGARLVFGLAPDPLALRKTVQLSRAMRPDRFVSLLPELVSFDERAAFESLPVPTVVVVGDRDRLTPPRYARALVSTLPGAELVIWPGAGHMLMYERREALDWLLERLSQEAVAGKGAGLPPE